MIRAISSKGRTKGQRAIPMAIPTPKRIRRPIRSTLLAFICLPNIKTGAQRFASQTFAGAVAIGFEHRLLLVDQQKFSLKAV